jgi:hypothetical protein
MASKNDKHIMVPRLFADILRRATREGGRAAREGKRKNELFLEN